jgi:hypothetical protein
MAKKVLKEIAVAVGPIALKYLADYWQNRKK